MSFKDKIMQFINVTDTVYVEGPDNEENDDFDYQPEQPAQQPAPQQPKVRAEKASGSGNVVNINSSKGAVSSAQPKPHVVFQKIDKFDEVGAVADILNEKRIVILNLETCPNDISQRIIDFLFGVAYANHGEFKKVAGRAYIITPHSVPVTGELLDEISDDMNDSF